METLTEARKVDFIKFTYYPRYNIAYLQFDEKRSEIETIRIYNTREKLDQNLAKS